MCIFLLLAYLQFLSKADRSMQLILRLLQKKSLLMRRDVVAFRCDELTSLIPIPPQRQPALTLSVCEIAVTRSQKNY
jgi:hypothetical protein